MENSQQFAELIWGSGIYIVIGLLAWIAYVILKYTSVTLFEIIRSYYRLWCK